MPHGLRLFLPPIRSCLHLLDDIDGWTALSICRICPAKVANISFLSIDHCGFRWLCCWVRCWMLQDIDNMEARSVFYVKVGTFTQLEQSNTSLLTVNKPGIVKLTIQYHLIVSVSFIYYPGILWDNHQQTSFPSNNVLYIAVNHAISAVLHLKLSLLTNTQCWTDILHVLGLWETLATCSYMRQNSSWV